MKNKSDINYWIHIKIIIYYLQLACSLSKKKKKKIACSLHCEATILHTLRFLYHIFSYRILIFLGRVCYLFIYFNSLLIVSYI